MNETLSCVPIGFVRSPHRDLLDAPRQPGVSGGASGTIELLPGRHYEDALSDLETWSHIWVLFWFHRALGFRPKVRPPRSAQRRGLFSTRSPHRPNPLGLSAVRLVRIEGLVLHVDELDLVDGTPILDIKPYVAYTDARPVANAGWLEERDPNPSWQVQFDPLADSALEYLSDRGIALRAALVRALSLGPAPHAYRRIVREGEGFRIAHKEWRAFFSVDEAKRVVQVSRIGSGYRISDLARAAGTELLVHREFVDLFGP